jgi:adenylate cyclase
MLLSEDFRFIQAGGYWSKIMILRLKNKNLLKIIFLLAFFLLSGIFLFFIVIKQVWNTYDYKLLDFFYKQSVRHGYGPKPSFYPQIVYLTITDDTYDFFGKNYLDRKDLAALNNALSHFDPQAVAYDIIFARGSDTDADQQFTQSLINLGSVYLPTGLALSDEQAPFEWGKGLAYDRLRSDCFTKPIETGTARPYHATQALFQYRDFAQAATGSGDISAHSDSDGVYRHCPLLIKVDEAYYPSFSFRLFLDWAGVSFERVIVEWGNRIIIQATKESLLEADVIIPIDEKGRVFVPFVDSMGKDFNLITAHDFLTYFADENLRGNLLELLEGNFIMIADVAIGTSDLGYTPLEANTVLTTIHVSVLNGLLTNRFYTPWSFIRVTAAMGFIFVLLVSAATIESRWFLYGTGIVVMFGLLALTWSEFIHFRLFPIMTIGSVFLVIFFGLTIALEAATSRDRAFIKNTFSKYVPKTVVAELLCHPELIKLGGEERVVTVFFSDIVSFTTVSEQLPPATLVGLLNEYFTEMTAIILEQGGIIDKYLGDAIMAEFGVPLPTRDHADRAVLTALKMEDRLIGLRDAWAKRGLPPLHCRMGINTNKMIVGNIGSQTVFDYTVIGDAVNLASRLESANKLYGTCLIISQDTYERLTPGRFKVRILDFIRVKGKANAVKIYEVYGVENESPDSHDAYYKTYNTAFEAYLSGDYSFAKTHFLKALSLRPQDLCAKRLIARLETLAIETIPPGWDGSVSLIEK